MDGVTTCIVAAVSRFFQLCDKFDLAIDALDELQNVLPIEMRRRVAGDAHPVCFLPLLLIWLRRPPRRKTGARA